MFRLCHDISPGLRSQVRIRLPLYKKEVGTLTFELMPLWHDTYEKSWFLRSAEFYRYARFYCAIESNRIVGKWLAFLDGTDRIAVNNRRSHK